MKVCIEDEAFREGLLRDRISPTEGLANKAGLINDHTHSSEDKAMSGHYGRVKRYGLLESLKKRLCDNLRVILEMLC